jgi:ribose transport system ATP-binding protein
MPLLEARNITKQFGGVPALKGANLVCGQGRITGLLGANGSGKSTLSKIITGVYYANGGEILFKGKPIKVNNPVDAKRKGIAMAFQNLSLLPDLTVWQNVVLGFEKQRRIFLDNKDARQKTREIMNRFIERFDIERRIGELDAGEKQIVEVAKAIVQDPELLILDEPTASLESSQVKVLLSCMRELTAKGVGIIFTSHRLKEVLDICDDVVVFRNGEDVGKLDFDKDEKNIDTIVEMITGGYELGARESGVRDRPDAETMFEVKNLSYRRFLHSVSFSVKKGEIVGVGGLAGQGQNELLLALAGYYNETAADFLIDGKGVDLSDPAKAIRNGVVLVPGDRLTEGLNVRDSVYENILLPGQASKGAPFVIPRKMRRAESEAIVNRLSIQAASIDLPVEKLSGGNQQKVVVGKWLPFDIKVLLLSDPAKGVDVAAKRDLYAFVREMANDKGVCVILYASDSEELIDNCGRVLIMYEGGVSEELAGAEITEEAIALASLRGSNIPEAARGSGRVS